MCVQLTRAAGLLVILSAVCVWAQDEEAAKVRNELLARKRNVAMAVKIDMPADVAKDAKLTRETVTAVAERQLKAQGIGVVEAGNDRQDMALVIRLGMKDDGTGSCELNVIVVDENPKTGEKKAAMAYDSFTKHQGRTPKDLGGQLSKALGKALGDFCATHKKHNPDK